MNTSSRRALITGSTGFVGSHLSLKLVSAGWEVHRLLRVGLEEPVPAPAAGVWDHLWDGSTDAAMAILAQTRPDAVVHLASLFLAEHSAKDLDALVSANILVGSQVVEAATAAGCRGFVNAGTSWQHFQGAEYDPVCLYAATKQAFEDLLAYYVGARGLRVVTLKLFDTYGPGDRRAKLFAALRNAARGGGPLAMSPGGQLLDLAYIDDVTRAFETAAESVRSGGAGGHRVYAVSSGERHTLKDVVALYESVTRRHVAVRWGGRSYRDREVMTPWEGPSLPGWRAEVDLRRGIELMEAGDARGD
jgi:nucleoside-diphosphate-sugar epimerase